MPADDFEDIFNEMAREGFFDFLDADGRDDAHEAFLDGFTHHSNDPGYDSTEAMDAREMFWEIVGMDPSEFDWEAWAEAMGYE